MDNNHNRIRWSELVKALVALSNMSQVGRDLVVSQKEVKRWCKGEAKPDGENAQSIVRLCEKDGRINWRTFQGLSPVYDFGKAFDRNVLEGPRGLQNTDDLWLPPVETKPLWGRELNSPIGVPASVLTINSEWVGPLSHLGFDVLTVKTCRTKEKPAHPLPNMVYVPELGGPVSVGAMPVAVVGRSDLPHEDVSRLSGANSFGMPCPASSEWMADLKQSVRIIEDNGGQLLIASVVGTADQPDDDLVADFIECSRLAYKCGPHAIEQNYSCPNAYGRERSVYQSPSIAKDIATGTRALLPDVKLLVKIGYLPPDELRALFEAVYESVDGFTCINTVPVRIVSEGQDGEPVFPGDKRNTGGVSGPAIREYAIQTVSSIRALADEYKPELVIIGVGGVSTAAHVKQFQAAGANVVQICTAALFDPLVASKIRHDLARDSDQPSRAKVGKDFQVMFRDDNIARAFERTVSVANRDGLYFDECWQVVELQWVAGYRQMARSVDQPGALPYKTRREAPTEQQIRTWVRNARSRH